MASARKSIVWRIFNENTVDRTRATCSLCEENVARGGTAVGGFTTTNLWNHLLRAHKDVYDQLKEAEQAEKMSGKKKRQTVKQQSNIGIAAAFEKARPLARDDPRAATITKLIMEMIALDDLPFHVVKGVGFCRLIQFLEPRYQLPDDKHFRHRMLPDVYAGVKGEVAKEVEDADHISFTNDTWSTSQCTDSLISLTGHWIDGQWRRRNTILHAQHVEGAHTADNLAGAVGRMLNEWNVREKTHVVIRDNAANISKAMNVADVASIGCFAHTIQLCVNKPLDSKDRNLQFLSNLLAQCRAVVGHFSHSVLVKERLVKIQEGLANHPQRKLIQDVATRWNSTYYMAERLAEQEKAVVTYDREFGFPGAVTVPDRYKFEWLRELVALLKPLEEATREMCADDATAADVIPMITAIRLQLSRHDGGNMTIVKDVILSQLGTLLSFHFFLNFCNCYLTGAYPGREK